MQLAVVLASATEWQLATHEGMLSKRSTPKHELRRQKNICATLVSECRSLGVRPQGLSGVPCPRLAAALEVQP
jgi:hypothetical protein